MSGKLFYGFWGFREFDTPDELMENIKDKWMDRLDFSVRY